MALDSCTYTTAIETFAIAMVTVSFFWMVFLARKYGLDNFFSEEGGVFCPNCGEKLAEALNSE